MEKLEMQMQKTAISRDVLLPSSKKVTRYLRY